MFGSSYFTPGFFTPGYFKTKITVIIPPVVVHKGGSGWYRRQEPELLSYDEDIIDFIIAFVLNQ